MTHKVCKKCGDNKPISEFQKSYNILKDGTKVHSHISKCTKCMLGTWNQYKKNKWDKVKVIQKTYQQKIKNTLAPPYVKNKIAQKTGISACDIKDNDPLITEFKNKILITRIKKVIKQLS